MKKVLALILVVSALILGTTAGWEPWQSVNSYSENR
jgi:hypothetical protein